MIHDTSPKLGAKELRVSEPTKEQLAKIRRREIYIICDNVLDTYNIGSIFRLADAVAAKRVYLCGQSETPPNSRITKASVGTDKWVRWEYLASAREAINNLRGKFSPAKAGSNNNISYSSSPAKPEREVSLKVIAIEQNPKAIDFRKVDYKKPVAFIVGNETDGVSKEALALADEIVEIPMFGVNRSLNVMVSLAIVMYRSIFTSLLLRSSYNRQKAG